MYNDDPLWQRGPHTRTLVSTFSLVLYPRSSLRSLRKLRTAVGERRRQRLKRRRRRSRVVVLRRSIHPRWLASLGIAARRRCSWRTVSEALTTEDGLLRERSGVQCEAQASLSALRRELPPLAAAFAYCGFCCSLTLCLGFVPYRCACTLDPQIRVIIGW